MKQTYGTGIFEKYAGVWYARYVDARGVRRVEKAGSRSAAKNLYRRRRDEILQGKLFPENRRRGVKFADLATDATRALQARGRRAGNIALVKGWFANQNAADVTPADVERELNHLRQRGHRRFGAIDADTGKRVLRARGVAPATLNRFRAAVSAIFTLAQRDGKVLTNPARLVHLERENNARVRFLTDDEEMRVRQVIREVAPAREPDFDLALHTGLRKAEQYSLRWVDVDLLNGVLTVQRGKGNKRRHVPINFDARAALAKLRQHDNASGLVCAGGLGADGYWATHNWFEGALRAAHVNNFRWHDLRHTFASRLRMAGVDLATIADLLGHTTMTMTRRYAHLAPGYLRKAVDAIAKTPSEGTTTTENVARVV